MFRMAQTEQWKSCVYFMEQLYIDVQEQMGCVASAHLGKRTSFLITAIAMRRAAHEFEKRRHKGKIHARITRWADQRRAYHRAEQSMPLFSLIFLDDMLELAVGLSAREIVQVIQEIVIRDKLGVGFSSEPEATGPFSTRFDFIVAEFDTSDCNNIKSRPAKHMRQSLQRTCMD